MATDSDGPGGRGPRSGIWSVDDADAVLAEVARWLAECAAG